MKSFSIRVLSLLVLTLGAAQAFALEEGEQATCVMLNHYLNGAESNHCITDANKSVEKKPVLVEFFSVTCSACIANLPNLKQLMVDLAGKATLRMVSIDKDKSKLLDFIKEYQLESIEIALDPDKIARKAYKIQYTPTMFMLNDKEVVALKHIGTLDEDSYKEIVNKVESLQ